MQWQTRFGGSTPICELRRPHRFGILTRPETPNPHLRPMAKNQPGRRPFTVEEANSSLPLLNAVFDQLDGKKRELFDIRLQIEILEVMWGERLATETNPDRAAYERYSASAKALIRDLNEVVSREILGRGMRFPPGGLDQGLIDFPTVFEGRWVFICWQRGEPEVRFWHELDGGYAGRREILAEQIIGMGQMDDDAGDLADSA